MIIKEGRKSYFKNITLKYFFAFIHLGIVWKILQNSRMFG